MHDMTRRNAVVTGGGSGIGRATAKLLAEAGAHVAVADINEGAAQSVTAEIEAAHGRAWTLPLDVTDEEAVARAAATVGEQFGEVHALANIAGGGLGRYPKAMEADTAYWDGVMDLNAKSTFLMCRAFLPLMPTGGSIINMASSAALTNNPRFALYGTAKAAVVRFTRAIAAETAPLGVRVNVLCPGPIANDGGGDEGRAATVPLGRLGQPIDVAHLVLFLASEDASFITGSVHVIDGGRGLLGG